MKRRVLLLAIDAAEKSLVDQWMRSGDLPNLRRLRDQGAYGPLSSVSHLMNAATWPTLTAGVWPTAHGINHYLMWQPEQMAYERPTADWVGYDPFWYPLAARGRHVIALDVPYAHLAVSPANSTELRGWGSQYTYELPNSHPPQLMKTISRQFGREALGPYHGGLKRTRQMLSMRKKILTSVEKQLGAARYMMRTYPWDLFMLVFGGPHRGGHQFWDKSGLIDTPTDAESALLATSIRDLYQACDAAVGELVELAGEQVTVMVLALHGMGANEELADILPEMVECVLGESSDDIVAGSGMLQRLREGIPVEWRSAVKSRLPSKMQDKLTAFWRGQTNYDWETTKAFCPPPDLQGYVRINLKGREAKGIVPPGEAYDHLCRQISAGLQTFVDVDTGEPIIEAVHTPAALFPAGERLHLLPDLIVQWSGIPAKRLRAVASPQFGEISPPAPGKAPDGQSGHHVGGGWLIAAGPGIQAQSSIANAHIIDVAPTIYGLLNETPPENLDGHPIFLPGLEN